MAEKEKEPNEGNLSSLVASHYNSIEESGKEARAFSRIFHLRNFNNWIKSMLIGEYTQNIRKAIGEDGKITVLDIGAGKGGDLLKWKKGRIHHLVCADIAETSLQHCQQRFRDLRRGGQRFRDNNHFTAEFIAADCTKVRLKERYKDPNILFDLVSCQFTFHYCFESQAQAKQMIQNISECLKPGGYFIGTTPDAYDIVKRLRQSDNLKFGNEVYSIEFESKDSFPLFGTRYLFFLEDVVNCPEFLVYFPLFEHLAKQHGMTLVYKKRFEDMFDDFKSTSDGLFLLRKLPALETYIPLDDKQQLMGKIEDYEHAKEYAEKDLKAENKETKSRVQPCKIGTLSKAEWEAASLYIAFAFKKNESPAS